LARVGDIWSMLILRNVGLGQTRFDVIRRDLGIAPNVLSGRLKALTEEGLVERRRYDERPPRDEYVLTPLGRDFMPVLHVIGAWARRNFGAGSMSHFVDVRTGAPIEPVVVDARSGTRIEDVPARFVAAEGKKAARPKRRAPGKRRSAG
jgi:DNA-binding HxlR family transcriptional regulator